MKKLLIAAGILAMGACAASAQPVSVWKKEAFPYAQKYHSVCQDKARRLNGYEIRAKADGKLTKKERATMATLTRDLDKTCGHYRFKG